MERNYVNFVTTYRYKFFFLLYVKVAQIFFPSRFHNLVFESEIYLQFYTLMSPIGNQIMYL